jgi:hypothetical protein
MRGLVRSRRRRLVAVIAVGLLSALLAIAAERGGASGARAEGVNDVLAQVQTSFGDGGLVAASATGSVLSVTLGDEKSPLIIRAKFEAQILSYAVAEWAKTNDQEPVTSVTYSDSSGNQLLGSPTSGDAVSTPPDVTTLSGGACASAAQAAIADDNSLSLTAVRQLPWLGGACLLQFATTDPAGFAASAPATLGTLFDAIGNPNDRPHLVEVDDTGGNPEFIASWVPGFGGTSWIHPGLSQAFNMGGSSGP